MPDQPGLPNKRELENSPLFRGVELETIIGLLQACAVQELKQGEVLVHGGQLSHSLFLVLAGRLCVQFKGPLDPIAVLEPGEVLGELSVIDGQISSAHVVADLDSRLLVLDEKTCWTLVEASHSIARNLLFVLTRRLRHGDTVIEASLLAQVSDKELEEFQPREIHQEVIEGTEFREEDIEAETARLYKTATEYVSETIRGAQENQRPNIEQGEQLVKRMIDSLADSSALLLLATNRRQEFSVSTHSVNVTIFSQRIAQTLKYKPQKQEKVALAALLHEIGVVWLPQRLLHQEGEVSPQMRQRPAYGAKILEELCPEQDWLAKIVGQVYEREDGSGFPEGLMGKDICEEAKILGIADVLEACIHNRPYRKASTSYELLQMLTRGGTFRRITSFLSISLGNSYRRC